MINNKHYVHFAEYFSEKAKTAIMTYVEESGQNFWQRNIHVEKDRGTGLISIRDGRTRHEIFEHECRM